MLVIVVILEYVFGFCAVGVGVVGCILLVDVYVHVMVGEACLEICWVEWGLVSCEVDDLFIKGIDDSIFIDVFDDEIIWEYCVVVIVVEVDWVVFDFFDWLELFDYLEVEVRFISSLDVVGMEFVLWVVELRIVAFGLYWLGDGKVWCDFVTDVFELVVVFYRYFEVFGGGSLEVFIW